MTNNKNFIFDYEYVLNVSHAKLDTSFFESEQTLNAHLKDTIIAKRLSSRELRGLDISDKALSKEMHQSELVRMSLKAIDGLDTNEYIRLLNAHGSQLFEVVKVPQLFKIIKSEDGSAILFCENSNSDKQTQIYKFNSVKDLSSKDELNKCIDVIVSQNYHALIKAIGHVKQEQHNPLSVKGARIEAYRLLQRLIAKM